MRVTPSCASPYARACVSALRASADRHRGWPTARYFGPSIQRQRGLGIRGRDWSKPPHPTHPHTPMLTRTLDSRCQRTPEGRSRSPRVWCRTDRAYWTWVFTIYVRRPRFMSCVSSDVTSSLCVCRTPYPICRSWAHRSPLAPPSRASRDRVSTTDACDARRTTHDARHTCVTRRGCDEDDDDDDDDDNDARDDDDRGVDVARNLDVGDGAEWSD